MRVPRSTDVQSSQSPSLSQPVRTYVGLAIGLGFLLIILTFSLTYWRYGRNRGRSDRRTSPDRRSEEEEIKDDMDDEYSVGTPRSPARITAILNTPGSTPFTPPRTTVTLAVRTPQSSQKRIAQTLTYTPPPPPPSRTTGSREMRSTPQGQGRSVPQPLESIEEVDEDAAEQECVSRGHRVAFDPNLPPDPSTRITSHPPPPPWNVVATRSAQTFEEAVKRFMNHMNDQRAFVQERSVDARVTNRRQSNIVEPVVSMLAVPGEIDGPAGDGEGCDDDDVDDFVSFAWSYYGHGAYDRRFSSASEVSSPFGEDDGHHADVSSIVPQILVSAH